MKSAQTAVSSSMTNPVAGPTPNWVREESAELIWVIMSRSNAVYSGAIPRFFFVLVRMLFSIYSPPFWDVVNLPADPEDRIHPNSGLRRRRPHEELLNLHSDPRG